MHEAPQFGARPPARAKRIQPLGTLQPKQDFTCFSRKVPATLRWWDLRLFKSQAGWPAFPDLNAAEHLLPVTVKHQGNSPHASMAPQVTSGPCSLAFLLETSRPFACRLPKSIHGGQDWEPITPSQPPWKILVTQKDHWGGCEIASLTLVERWKGPKLEISPWLIIATATAWEVGQEEEASRERRRGDEASIILNRWSKARLLTVFLHLTHKDNGFTRWQEAFSHLFPPKNRGVTALPGPSPLSGPSNGPPSSNEKRRLFTSTAHCVC